ncbi:MAG: hypothetical protein AAF918_08560 [Pseudomonadota bacterium]
MSRSLLEGTSVGVDYLPPKRLPINRVENWLRKHRTDRFPAYDAFVSIGAAVPGLQFYTTLRQTNIRLVTIDIAYAQIPEGERVVIGAQGDYFWLNGNNLLLMLGILRRDLQLLWPEFAGVIDDNYQTSSRAIRKASLAIDTLLIDQAIDGLSVTNAKHVPLAAGLSLDVVDPEEIQSLALRGVTVGSSPAGQRRHERYWLIDDIARFNDARIEARVHANLNSLRAIAFGNP